MARIRIDLPEHFLSSTELPIHSSHINEAGHLDNLQMLTLVSEARQRFFKALGYTQTDVEGVGTVVADAAIQYLSEAFEGEILVFDMTASDFNKYGCDLVYRVREKSSEREVARGKFGIVFFDYGQRKITAAPPAFIGKLAAG
ncbi:thioesterase family protein [Azoarcus sp. KH32C]|uniref:acyl-CoA thioesterase n=1 Tax=Azoarcus sp. KH32C TaxID=748247 RepID=UPI0002386EBD|nr:thioesterase family protein [Azoarcus sp. KH32C]BAL24437.1 thioesterase [Azoarcus sp. KH32C]